MKSHKKEKKNEKTNIVIYIKLLLISTFLLRIIKNSPALNSDINMLQNQRNEKRWCTDI